MELYILACIYFGDSAAACRDDYKSRTDSCLVLVHLFFKFFSNDFLF